MIWYLILSILFSLGISLTVIEMYFTHISLKKQFITFIIVFILGIIFWPLLLIIIDGTIVWNTILRIRYCNEIDKSISTEQTLDEEK